MFGKEAHWRAELALGAAGWKLAEARDALEKMSGYEAELKLIDEALKSVMAGESLFAARRKKEGW